MRAFVSDQGADFASLVISTGPDFTVVAALELPPGSWVVFATVALAAATSATGTSIVQTGFLLDGEIYSTLVQSDFVIADTLDGSISGFRVVPLTTGLALDRPRTVQVGCVATQPDTVSSQPTTITAIQVESVTRIRDQFPGALCCCKPRPLRPALPSPLPGLCRRVLPGEAYRRNCRRAQPAPSAAAPPDEAASENTRLKRGMRRAVPVHQHPQHRGDLFLHPAGTIVLAWGRCQANG